MAQVDCRRDECEHKTLSLMTTVFDSGDEYDRAKKEKREFSLNLIAERDATWLLFSHFATKHCVNFRRTLHRFAGSSIVSHNLPNKSPMKMIHVLTAHTTNEVFFSPSQFSKYVDRACRIWCNNINKITTCTVMSIRRRRRNCLHCRHRRRRYCCCYRCSYNVQRFCWYSLSHTHASTWIYIYEQKQWNIQRAAHTIHEPTK